MDGKDEERELTPKCKYFKYVSEFKERGSVPLRLFEVKVRLETCEVFAPKTQWTPYHVNCESQGSVGTIQFKEFVQNGPFVLQYKSIRAALSLDGGGGVGEGEGVGVGGGKHG